MYLQKSFYAAADNCPATFIPSSSTMSQVFTTCELPINYELPSGSELPLKLSGKAKSVEQANNKSYAQVKIARSSSAEHIAAGMEFDLTYITERLICASFPSNSSDEAYKNSLHEIARMLKCKHGDNYLVINFSGSCEEIGHLNTQVVQFGWPLQHAPHLDILCSICKAVDTWLSQHPQHVAVLHCKGDLGSAAIVVAAYMYYSAMCASADQALDRFAMKRFYEDKLAVVIQPSQRRYVDYFHGLLSGTILMNSNPIFLHRVILHQVLGQKPGGRVFLRVYQGLQPCYTSPIYSRMDATACDKLCITIFPMLKLKGDILVKCYQKIAGGRQVIFRMQFHTCVVQGPDLLLGKKELDEACTDLLFPLDGKVELLFSSSSAVATTSKAFLQNDRSITVDHSSLDPILRYDSYVDLSLLLDAGGKHVDPQRSASRGLCTPKKGTVPHARGPTAIEATEHALSLSSDSGHSSVSGRISDELRPQVSLLPRPPSSQGHNIGDGHHTQSPLTPQEQSDLDDLLKGLGLETNGMRPGSPHTGGPPACSTQIDPENEAHFGSGPCCQKIQAQVHFENSSTFLAERETDILDDELLPPHDLHSVDSLGTLSSTEGGNTSGPCGGLCNATGSSNGGDVGLVRDSHKTSQCSLLSDSTGYNTVEEPHEGSHSLGINGASCPTLGGTPRTSNKEPGGDVIGSQAVVVSQGSRTSPICYGHTIAFEEEESSSTYSWVQQQQQQQNKHYRQGMMELSNNFPQSSQYHSDNPSNVILPNHEAKIIGHQEISNMKQHIVPKHQEPPHSILIPPAPLRGSSSHGATQHSLEETPWPVVSSGSTNAGWRGSPEGLPPVHRLLSPIQQDLEQSMETLNMLIMDLDIGFIPASASVSHDTLPMPSTVETWDSSASSAVATPPMTGAEYKSTALTCSQGTVGLGQQASKSFGTTGIAKAVTSSSGSMAQTCVTGERAKDWDASYRMLAGLDSRQRTALIERGPSPWNASNGEDNSRARSSNVHSPVRSISPEVVNIIAANPGGRPRQRNLHSYKEAFDEAEPDGNSPPRTSRSPEARSPVGLAETPLSALKLKPHNLTEIHLSMSSEHGDLGSDNMKMTCHEPRSYVSTVARTAQVGVNSSQQPRPCIEQTSAQIYCDQKLRPGDSETSWIQRMPKELTASAPGSTTLDGLVCRSGSTPYISTPQHLTSQYKLASRYELPDEKKTPSSKAINVMQHGPQQVNGGVGQQSLVFENIEGKPQTLMAYPGTLSPDQGRQMASSNKESPAFCMQLPGTSGGHAGYATVQQANHSPYHKSLSRSSPFSSQQPQSQTHKVVVNSQLPQCLTYNGTSHVGDSRNLTRDYSTPTVIPHSSHKQHDSATNSEIIVFNQQASSSPADDFSSIHSSPIGLQLSTSPYNDSTAFSARTASPLSSYSSSNPPTPGFPYRPSVAASQTSLYSILSNSPRTTHRTFASMTPPSPVSSHRKVSLASSSPAGSPASPSFSGRSLQANTPLDGSHAPLSRHASGGLLLSGTNAYNSTAPLSYTLIQDRSPPRGHTPRTPLSGQTSLPEHLLQASYSDGELAGSSRDGGTVNADWTAMMQPALPEKRNGSMLSDRSVMASPSTYGVDTSLESHAKFVQATSNFWYKPDISREEAINMLKDREPGAFVIRVSSSFRGAYGLAMKVASPPSSAIAQGKKGDPSCNELVRHFLIESTNMGVRLKGCPNEPVFGSLCALVYQHSTVPLALPCKLVIPENDPSDKSSSNSAAELLKQGAACNVFYLNTVEMESLTGSHAIAKAASETLNMSPRPVPTTVHFKVSAQGITLTDNQRRLFFRRHYPVASITFCDVDPERRPWTTQDSVTGAKIFGFVARKPGSSTDNDCHLFAELEPEQPASAIVNFVSRVLLGSQKL
uniref:tensin-1-like isoform X2 n=1 Tax=Myxine glutinosa TaxID=7769 RepID=UPI00358F03FC